MTISHTGGRWQVSFQVRYIVAVRPVKQPLQRLGGAVGVDVGITHLATLSRTIDGCHRRLRACAKPATARRPTRPTESTSTVGSPAVSEDRRTGRSCSQRRARLHGSVAAIRKNAHHQLANELAGRFDPVVIEDLNVAGMTHNRPFARALADAGLRQLLKIIATESADRYHSWSTGQVLSVVEDLFGLWDESQTAPRGPTLRLRALRTPSTGM